ncbi:MAG: GNAT family N-acetyltransferase [Bacteroidota bacterium]
MEDIKIEKLSSSQVIEFQQLITLFNHVFESPAIEVASKEFCETTLNKEDFIAFAAASNDEIIGGITAHVLPSYYRGKLEIFIYDLAVSEAFRRKGVARALMNALFEEAANSNIEILFVDAEVEDREALLFYEAMGGKKLSTAQYTFQL